MPDIQGHLSPEFMSVNSRDACTVRGVLAAWAAGKKFARSFLFDCTQSMRMR
jgi:hypothetical protein